MHRLPKSVLTAALILLILVGYFGLRTATRPETTRQTASTVVEGEADPTRPAVQVRRAHPVTHTIFANFKGRTEANRSVTVRSETAGSVETTPVREGQIVNTGALLCGLAAHHRGADHYVAQQRHVDVTRQVRGEGQHVGGAVLAPVGLVQAGHFVGVDQAQAQFGVSARQSPGQGGSDPASYVILVGDGFGGGGLDIHVHGHRWLLSSGVALSSALS